MSDELDDADLIRTRLMTAPNEALGELAVALDITGLDPIIDRQQDVLASVKNKVAKGAGISIVIAVQDYGSFSPNAGVPRAELGYKITVWGKSVRDQGNHPVAQVMKTIIRRLWQWNPRGGHSHGEVKLTGGGRVPNSAYTIYDLDFSIPTNF